MPEDARIGQFVRAVAKRHGKITPEWEAMAMVAAFGQDFPHLPEKRNSSNSTNGNGYLYKLRDVGQHHVKELVDGLPAVCWRPRLPGCSR